MEANATNKTEIDLDKLLPAPCTHEEAVLWFISRLDLDMVNDLLDNERTYEDKQKGDFILMLKNFFDYFINQGDTHLLVFPGKCGGRNCPNNNHKGYQFYGNRTKDYFNLIFETDRDERITDLYECTFFKTTVDPDFTAGKKISEWDFNEEPF